MQHSLATTARTDKALRPRDITLTRVTSLVAIAAGLLDEIGWARHISALTQIASGLPTMKPLAGLCFILVGTAVLLLNNPRREAGGVSRERRAIPFAVSALAIVVLLICGATFFESAGITGTTVDTLLFTNAISADKVVFPGRMSLAT